MGTTTKKTATKQADVLMRANLFGDYDGGLSIVTYAPDEPAMWTLPLTLIERYQNAVEEVERLRDQIVSYLVQTQQPIPYPLPGYDITASLPEYATTIPVAEIHLPTLAMPAPEQEQQGSSEQQEPESAVTTDRYSILGLLDDDPQQAQPLPMADDD